MNHSLPRRTRKNDACLSRCSAALAGNPNVGKSTLFNTLTGLHQHTGNWTGKTVACADGQCRFGHTLFSLTDLPGTYSLLSDSPEEEIAAKAVCSGAYQLIIAVCDATCLERSLALVFQILSLTPNVIVCVNLCDEAEKKGIRIDFALLEQLLGVPVVGISAAKRSGIKGLLAAAEEFCGASPVFYQTCEAPPDHSMKKAEVAARQTAVRENPGYRKRDFRADRIATGPVTGTLLMLLLLLFLFWLSISGANYPSRLLSAGFDWLEIRLAALAGALHAPDWLRSLLISGIYRVSSWVVAVMLPPMAIFFPLFTLLEDLGYLPRVAFNLDHHFKKCSACGKQALCMCMGLGCNAAGVTGCRIIHSPRERLIAILTNTFIPCNGPLPHPDLPDHHLLCGNGERDPGKPSGRPDPDRGHCPLHHDDLRRLPASGRHRPEGSSLLLHSGNASLPASPDPEGTGPFRAGPHFICPWKGRHDRRSRRPGHLAGRQSEAGRGNAAPVGFRLPGSPGKADGTGRRDPACLPSGLPGQ